LQWFLSVQI